MTGAAVGVSGQVFTIIPHQTACYHCVFPSLDENSMPTCSTEGVHPSILSIVGGIEVAEAVKIMIGRHPTLANKLLYIDMDNLDFNSKICGFSTSRITGALELLSAPGGIVSGGRESAGGRGVSSDVRVASLCCRRSLLTARMRFGPNADTTRQEMIRIAMDSRRCGSRLNSETAVQSAHAEQTTVIATT